MSFTVEQGHNCVVKNKRELFVFAGQSNMMGAGVFPPKTVINVSNSFEYLHKGVRMGEPKGRFKISGFPCGEYTYADLKKAYPQNMLYDMKSELQDHTNNAYFDVSMSNLKNEDEKTVIPFPEFSEENFVPAPAIPPYAAQMWEEKGHLMAYAHIAKGGVSILHYFNDDMLEKYHTTINQKCAELNVDIPKSLEINDMCRGASEYFKQKTAGFFKDSEEHFQNEDLSIRCLVWLQGESDVGLSVLQYKTLLEVFWDTYKKLGFTHFLCLRVGYFGSDGIAKVMKAQEEFCKENNDAYMMTRAYSLMPYAGQTQSEWFSEIPTDEYQLCRDSFYGFDNQHINEKGHLLLAERFINNLERLLYKNEEPILEPELVKKLHS